MPHTMNDYSPPVHESLRSAGQCAIDVHNVHAFNGPRPDSLRKSAFARFGAQNSRLLEFSHERVLDVIGFAPDLHT
jgi:hypothetical protein